MPLPITSFANILLTPFTYLTPFFTMDDKEPQHKTTSATTTPAATMSAYEASPSQILRDQRRAAISAAAGGDHL